MAHDGNMTRGGLSDKKHNTERWSLNGIALKGQWGWTGWLSPQAAGKRSDHLSSECSLSQLIRYTGGSQAVMAFPPYLTGHIIEQTQSVLNQLIKTRDRNSNKTILAGSVTPSGWSRLD